MAESEYSFDNGGIAALISGHLLRVPPNQRPYAWQDDHVRQLLTDIKEAMVDEEDQYFLGTVVLVGASPARRLIADGQQRIATVSIVLARIRDLLLRYQANEDADAISSKHLKRYIRRQKDEEYLLNLNTSDDEFYRSIIIDLDWASEPPEYKDGWPPSNERLYVASEISLDFFETEVKNVNAEKAVIILNDWADFLEDNVTVVAVMVPDEVGAFRMFETLNDRGLRASQADILKNYLFSRVNPSELDTVHGLWNQIYAALEDVSEDTDEQMIKFLKHFWTLENGLTRDRELAASIKSKVKKAKQALKFVADAKEAVADYVAIFSPSDPKWKAYGTSVQNDIRVLAHVINIEQIVPLAFAVAHKFSTTEAKKAFSLFIAWSVRFMLGGSGRAGRLDKQYADLAMEVGLGKTTSAKSLRDYLSDKVPTNSSFERAAREAKVSNPVLARYYLLSLEKHLYPGSGEFEPSEDVLKVNLEHILPKTYRKDLGVDKLEHADLLNRLGNLSVMHAGLNRDSANSPFFAKKPFYRKSEVGITKELGSLRKFDRAAIDKRQERMAKAAPKIWSLSFR